MKESRGSCRLQKEGVPVFGRFFSSLRQNTAKFRLISSLNDVKIACVISVTLVKIIDIVIIVRNSENHIDTTLANICTNLLPTVKFNEIVLNIMSLKNMQTS